MTMERRLVAVLAALVLVALVSSSRVTHGEPGVTKNKAGAAAPAPKSTPPAKNSEADAEAALAKTKFTQAPLLTYQPLDGDLQFALQVKPELPAANVRPRDYLVLIATSASQAGPPWAASVQIIDALMKTAGDDDAISIWTVGTPEKEVTRCLSDDFQRPRDKKGEKKLRGALETFANKITPLGDTDLKNGLDKAIGSFDDDSTRQRILLFLGDGWSTHNTISAAERNKIAQDMVARRIAFFSVPLGLHLQPENLHGLATGTGGAVLRIELSQEKVDDVMKRFQTAFAGPILYNVQLQLPPEVTDFVPQRLPPLRGDSPTLVLGTMKPAKTLRYSVSGQVAGGPKVTNLAAAHIVPEAEADNYFLNSMLTQWRDKGKEAIERPALLRADRSLVLAYEQTRVLLQDMLVSAQLATEKNELEAAFRLFEQARQLAPHDVEVKAGLKIVKDLQEGRLTKKAIEEQLKKNKVNDKGDRLEKVNGALRWNRGQLLQLAQVDPKDPKEPNQQPKANPKDPKQGNAPPGGQEDVLQAHRDRQVIEEQKMQQNIETSIRQARRELPTNPRAALDLLTRTLADLQQHPQIGEVFRQGLIVRMEASLRDVATQGKAIEQRRLNQQKNLAVLQNELERDQQRRTTEERVEAQFRVFKGLMNTARVEEKTKHDVIYGLIGMAEEARAKGTSIPVVTQAAYNQVLASYHLQKYKDLKRLREERFLSILLEVEKSHVPFSDEPPIHFPPLAMYEAIKKLRKEKYEVTSLPDDEKGRIEANAISRLLAEPISMEDFQQPMTLKEALGLFYEKFAAMKQELPILVDTDAFKEETPDAPDIYETMIKFPPYPKRMTMGTALRLALSKIPTNNATYLIRRNYIEITTIERQTREKVLRVYPVGDLVMPISGGMMLGGGMMGGGMMGMGGGMMGMGGGMMSMGGGMMGMGGGMMGMGGGMMGMGGMGGMGMMGMGGMGMPMGGMGMGGMGMGMPMGGMGMGGMGMGMPMGGMGMGMPMGGMGMGMPMGGMGMGGMGMMGMGGMGMMGMPMGASGMGGGFNGSLGMMGATQSSSLIQIITQIVAPGEWFVMPQQNNNNFLGGMMGMGGFPGMFGMVGMMGMGAAPPPPPVNQGGPADIQQANTIQFFPPSLALIVRAPSRLHTSMTGGLIGGKKVRIDTGMRLDKERDLIAANPKGNFKVGAGNGQDDDPRIAKGPFKVPGKDLDPAKVWNEAFAKGGIEPGHVVATADFLFETGNFQHVAEFLKANLRHGVVVRPWVYEALAVALEESRASPDEVRRARLSAVALDPTDSQGFLQAARTMAENKQWDRALAFCRQAAQLEPAASAPFADALAYAELNKDSAAMEWAVGKLLSQDWPVDNTFLHRQAETRLHTLAQTLEKEQRMSEADKLRKALQVLQQRDLVVNLTWEAGAQPSQLELEVKEPCGTACSAQQIQTPGGGTLITNNLTEMTRTSYTAAEAFSGDYTITVRRLWGQPVGGQARLEIIQHLGTPKETRKLQMIKLSSNNALPVKLAGGRRATLASISTTRAPSKPKDEPPPSTSGGVLAKLREMAYPDYSGAVVSGPRGGASTPGAHLPSLATPGEKDEKSVYQSAVAPVEGGSTNLTGQVRISADRQELEMVMRPFFQGAGPITRPSVPLSVVPGGN